MTEYYKETRLHPLHTPDFLASYFQSHGAKLPNRFLGRSTAIILQGIANSISKPYLPVAVSDHGWDVREPTSDEVELFRRRIRDVVNNLNLKYMRIEVPEVPDVTTTGFRVKRRVTICFGGGPDDC